VTLIAGRYRLDREIGRGGMGTVWLAEDTVLGRMVAVKRIGTLPGATEADLDRVRRESRVSAMLSHEHVVVVFDLAAEGDEHWLVMEYVESETLAQLVRRRGALPPDEVAALVAQAATALAAAHRAGIVHRDVKPSNLLVMASGHVKLGDFGIARTDSDQALTQTGLLVGSPGYLAPEVVTGAPATSASDMWSLGATLFHALEGRPPYNTSEHLLGALYKVVNEEPPRPEHAGWLGPVVEGLMDHDPTRRWDAEQVRQFLQAGQAGAGQTRLLPVLAEPEPAVVAATPSPATSARQRARRRWQRLPLEGRAAGVAMAVLVVLLLGVAVSQIGFGGDHNTPGASSGTPSKGPSPAGTTGSSAAETRPTETDMEKFVESYLATAPTDPRSSFAQLTPAYRAQSGGFDGYERFWGTVESARASSIKAYPADMTVSFLADYRLTNGKRRTDGVTLHLTYDGGKYRIDGDDSRPVRS
jgi:serine/threonine protein kinase